MVLPAFRGSNAMSKIAWFLPPIVMLLVVKIKISIHRR
jgi:hypothetical protein